MSTYNLSLLKNIISYNEHIKFEVMPGLYGEVL